MGRLGGGEEGKSGWFSRPNESQGTREVRFSPVSAQERGSSWFGRFSLAWLGESGGLGTVMGR